jgi:hypothetical protein
VDGGRGLFAQRLEQLVFGAWRIRMRTDALDASSKSAYCHNREQVMIIRIRWGKRGGHFHCRVFTAPGPDRTFANCGTIVFDEREWPEVKEKFDRIADLLPEVDG